MVVLWDTCDELDYSEVDEWRWHGTVDECEGGSYGESEWVECFNYYYQGDDDNHDDDDVVAAVIGNYLYDRCYVYLH